MEAQIEFDHYPEVVENGQGIRRLELLGLEETLRDPQERRDFFAQLDDEGFTRMLGYINSVTRGEAISYEYEDGASPSTYCPPLEDKKPLMNLAFQTVRAILGDFTLDTRVALRRAGLTMAGANAYTHPKSNGNGRAGRGSHYLIEFGTERGDHAFEEEMYAIIANTPVYDSDTKVALYDTPPGALDRALDAVMQQTQPETANLSAPKYASARVLTFLDMMRGATDIPVNERVVVARRTNADRSISTEYAPAGIDGRAAYEIEYLRFSAIPNRTPSDVPEDAKRVTTRKPAFEPAVDSTAMEYME